MPVIVFWTKCYRNEQTKIVATRGRLATQNFMIFPKNLFFIINPEIHFVNIQTTLLVLPKYSNKAPTIDVLRYQNRKFSAFS